MDRSADFATGQIDTSDPPSVVYSPLHVQMVNAQAAVEHEVEELLLEHIGGDDAGTGNVDDDNGLRGINGGAVKFGSRLECGHTRRSGDRQSPKLTGDSVKKPSIGGSQQAVKARSAGVFVA
ncbi:MAG: hypothetical protein ACJAZO_001188 [Myxococcota bacterium]